MKGNKMSAILAILLMLSGAIVAVPLTHAQPPGTGTVSGVSPNTPLPFQTTETQANPNNPYPPNAHLHFVAGTNGTTGTTFWADVDAYNVTFLSTYTIGFVYNPNLLTVLNVVNGSILDQQPASHVISISGNPAYAPGIVSAYGYSTTDNYYFNGTGAHKAVDLLNVEFNITGSLAYQKSVAGVPQLMMGFSYTNITIMLFLEDVVGNIFTPPASNATITYTLPAPRALPVSSGITRSTSYAGYSCTFSVTWADSVNSLSKYIFSFDNGVGTFTNSTAKSFTSNPQTVSITETLNGNVGATIRYRWYANDSSNFWNSTAVQTFVTQCPPPTYSAVTYSTTTAGSTCVFSITCSDKVALSKYIFSFDNGVGSFTNNTAVAFTSNPQTVFASEKLTSAIGATIRFRWFFNDTSGNWNSTSVESFTTTLISATVSPSSVVLDLGQSQTFTATVTGSSPPFSIQWYLNGVAVAGANSSTWTFKAVSVGTYSIYVKAVDSIGEVTFSSPVSEIVNPPPTILVTPTSVFLDVGESWTFEATVVNGTPPYSSFQWYVDGSPVINATGPTWTFTSFVIVKRTVYVNATDSLGVSCGSNLVSVTISSALSPKITPQSVVLDLGMSETFSSSVIGGLPPYTYQWYQWLPSGSQPFTGANTSTFEFTPSFTGLNFIYAKIADSLGSTVEIGAEVYVNPPISVSISPSSAMIDAGQSQAFTSNVSGGTAPYSYQWYADGSPVMGATSSIYTFTAQYAGIYDISVKVIDVFGMSGLSTFAVLTANAPPVIIVSPPSVTLDIGESWTFRAAMFNGTPPYSFFQWFLDGSPVPGATNNTYSYMPLYLANQTIYVTATDSLGFACVSNQVYVTVSSAMSLTISPVSTTMDLGQTRKYSVSVSGGTAPYSYQWYQWSTTGSKPFAGATSATFTFTPLYTGLNIIYVVVTDGVGVQVDWGATAMVNPSPVAVISPKSAVLDLSMSQKFIASVVNGTPSYSYQWYIDGSPVAGATNSLWTYTATSAGAHSVFLLVTDSADFVVYSNNATITVNPPLSASISPTSTTIDLGQNATFASSVSGGMPPYSYQWYLNGSIASGATQHAFILKPSQLGTYLVSLAATDSFGFITASNTATTIVNPVPTVAISPASVSIPLGQNQTFTATVTGGTSPFTYYWYVNGNLTAQTTVPTFTFSPTTISKYYLMYVTIKDAVGLSVASNTAVINGHDVAVTAIVGVDCVGHTAAKTVFGQGYPISMNVTTADPGYYSETFTVTAYLNSTAIASGSITLQSGATTIITLTGTATATLAYGHYIISAYATPVSGEVNTANNYIANSTRITVTIPGDMNGDGVVNGLDLHVLARNWLQEVPPASANADVIADGTVNGLELHIIARNWLKQVTL